jgi:large repetitive protein
MEPMRRMGTFLLLVILILTAFLWRPTPAMASSISLSPNYGFPGSIVTVTGYGFSGNETGIYLLFDSTPISSSINAINGNWITTVTIPSNATTGPHNIVAIGIISGTAYAPFNVTSQVAFSINTASGTVGTSVTVSGTGFIASETGINVLFDDTTVVTNRTATTAGAWSASFNVPATYSGNHIIDAYGSITLATSVPDLNFTVTPLISTNKTSGSVGTSVTVTGSGFAASESGIRVTYDDTPVGPIIKADAKGSWTSTFNVPASSGGEHIIDASGSSTPADSVPDLSFATGASISTDKNNGAAGTSVTVTGSGFAANESGINITFDGSPVGTANATAQGSWTATIVIPESPAGVHAIDAYGPSTQSSNVADVSFTTGGGISITPSSGAAGTSVSVSGFGFAANEKSIVITYDDAVVASDITANAQGQWTGSFSVPVSSSGAHAVGASGASTRAASIETVSFSFEAGISLNKSSGKAGTSVTVTGSGFIANESGITITFDGIQVDSGITANAQGTWTTTIIIPESPAGTHVIDAYGSSTKASSITDQLFTLISSSPTITSFTPSTGNNGTIVIITGTNFLYITGVYFGGIAVQSYTINSSNQITAIIGTGSSGYVTVTSLYGIGTSSSYFTYTSSNTLSFNLISGWNTFSTPISLVSSNDTINVIMSGANFDIAYRFDAQTQAWVILTGDYQLVPCEAIFIHMISPATITLHINPNLTSPYTKRLYAGWNMISMSSLSNMPVNQALASISQVTGGLVGYAIALSPTLGNQGGWSYTQGQTVTNQIMETAKGYWVFMVNEGVLAGFTSTPVITQ